MSSTTDGSTPGCLVFLLQLSSSMNGLITANNGICTKAQAARLLVDGLLEALVNGIQESNCPLSIDVAIVGYCAPLGSSVILKSLLPDKEIVPHFVRVADLPQMDVKKRKVNRPRKWCSNVSLEGDTDPASALAAMHWLLQRRLAELPAAPSTILIHCCDGSGIDDAYTLVARSLEILHSVKTKLFLGHCVFSTEFSGRMMPELYTGHLNESLERLWKASSVVPSATPNHLRHMPHALTINEWPRNKIINWIETLLMQPEMERTEGSQSEGAKSTDTNLSSVDAPTLPVLGLPDSIENSPDDAELAVLFDYKVLWLPKGGSSPEQWEDSYHLDATKGAVAISDGTAQGIFCKKWANLLTSRYTPEMNLRDSSVCAKWLEECRQTWKREIDDLKPHSIQRLRVVEVGAAATFLGFTIKRNAANLAWEAVAVGDSCLFWVRDSSLLATFPLTHHTQFGRAPLLLRSKRHPAPGFAWAGGACEAGDLFLLATDAIARWLLAEHSSGSVDWARLETIEQAAWTNEIKHLRDENLIVDDDCTLVCLRVSR